MGRDVRTWPHRPVLLTVGGSPNAMAHSGRNSKRRGPRCQNISLKFWFDQLFFENHDKLNIKNPELCFFSLRGAIVELGLFAKNSNISPLFHHIILNTPKDISSE
jgi:hypothetical protein